MIPPTPLDEAKAVSTLRRQIIALTAVIDMVGTGALDDPQRSRNTLATLDAVRSSVARLRASLADTTGADRG